MAAATPSRSASAERVRELPETLIVASLGRPHGLRGEVKAEVHSDVPGRLDPGSELLLQHPGRRPEPARILSNRPVKGGVLLRLAGIEDRDAAETLRGATLEIERSRVPPAPAGTFYTFELVGCRCRDERHGELGRLTDLEEDGGGLLLRIEDAARILLVPFVQSFLVRVDVAGGEITLDLPEGLIETCAVERRAGER